MDDLLFFCETLLRGQKKVSAVLSSSQSVIIISYHNRPIIHHSGGLQFQSSEEKIHKIDLAC